ncbi:hypothetical protein AOQ73_04660 [Bradyrhizobium pachyrhizi]|nr:hypothetical protein AOQ73_04660 [Bradyrhizobium pachyrhizi]
MRWLGTGRRLGAMFRLSHYDGVEYTFMALAAISFVALIVGVGVLLSASCLCDEPVISWIDPTALASACTPSPGPFLWIGTADVDPGYRNVHC